VKLKNMEKIQKSEEQIKEGKFVRVDTEMSDEEIDAKLKYTGKMKKRQLEPIVKVKNFKKHFELK